MKVILNKDLPNLGEEGEIKDVARGYARNFLIPNELVMPYSREAIAILESRKEQLEQRREEKRKSALDIKTRLETEELVLEMPAGDRGRLFGSVTSATLADALAARGIEVERKRFDIPEKTIKMVGTTRVRVRLYGEEEAELKVMVRASGEAPPEAAQVAEDSPVAEGAKAAEDADADEGVATEELQATVSDDETGSTEPETTTEPEVTDEPETVPDESDTEPEKD